MGGGKQMKPVVYDILVFENRQIFYLIIFQMKSHVKILIYVMTNNLINK